MADERLSDDEVVYRRILKKDAKNARLPNQFKLRAGVDNGLSVNRAKLITKSHTIAQGDPKYEYLLAAATVGAIRGLTADDGTPLHLDVIPTEVDKNPSHAEIRGPVAGQLPEGAPRALQREFQKGFPVSLDDA